MNNQDTEVFNHSRSNQNPDLNPNETQVNRLVKADIRVSENLDAAIRAVASENGISRSSVMRILMNEHMAEYLNTLVFVDRAQGEIIRTLLVNLLSSTSNLTFQIRKLGVNVNQIAKHLNMNQGSRASFDIDGILDEFDQMQNKGSDNLSAEDIDKIQIMIEKTEELITELGGVLWHILTYHQ